MGVVWGCFVSILGCQNGVVCVVCIRGIVYGGGLLVSNLVSLAVVSLLRFPTCARIFWRVRGVVCCDSHWIMARDNSLLGGRLAKVVVEKVVVLSLL